MRIVGGRFRAPGGGKAWHSAAQVRIKTSPQELVIPALVRSPRTVLGAVVVGLTITALTGTYGASAAPPSIARAKPVPLELHPQPVAAGAKLSPRLSDNPGKLQTVFVQLREAGSADAAASARSLGRSAQAAGEVGRER